MIVALMAFLCYNEQKQKTMHFSSNLTVWRRPSTTIIAASVLLGITLIGVWIFVRSKLLMEERLKETMRNSAALASLQFDAETLTSIRGHEDMENETFRKLVTQLDSIRDVFPAVRYAYLWRRTENPNEVAFIADADSLATDEELDVNGDGQADPDEEASYPGDIYDISDIPALYGKELREPAADDELIIDQWGALISGYAPIFDAAGNTVAILGLDMQADDYVSLAQSTFSPVAFLLFFLGGLVIAVYVSFVVWQRKKSSLEEIDQERQTLMRLAYHQLGTPLTIFRWTLESLQSQTDPVVKQAIEKHLEQMAEGITRLHSILDVLHDAEQVASGTISYTPEELNLTDVIATVCQQALPEMERNQIALHSQIGRNLQVHVDRKLIEGVIRELLDNAMKFSASGGAITVRAEQKYTAIQVDVSDKGCGMPRGELPKIFDKFYRGKYADTHDTHGNGLGLYISKGIIEKAGGRIWAESIEGSGTKISFTLPVK